MALATRLEQLGTETAFAVSLAAAEWGAKGNRIFPFHLGDLNIATPKNVVEAMDKAIADGKTGYCPAAGIPQLREALADDVGSRRGLSFTPANVVVQPGGKPVITKFIQAVMNPGDEVLYPNPGYPIYESQIEYFGGVAKAYRYLPSSTGFNIDLDQVKSLITPKTKAIIYNDLQNPIGAESTDAEREAIAELAIKHNLWVLSDEAYFEMRYSGKSKSIAQLPGMLERTVILYTFSKKFAMTGWRLGAAVAPLEIATMIAKLNTNDESCTTHFVQYGGVEALRGDQSSVTTMLDTLRERRDTAVNMLNAMPGVNVHSPEATFYLFPEVTGAMKAKGIDDLAVFAEKALHATGVSFCTRRHFGRPQPGEERQYIRFAFSGISNQDIKEGLELFGKWIAS
ncbi:MAG: aminotransferase class I/II-fold pyridoxal phosphate-dependent enzyme [Actinobacteria bacterium]|jgi:aspartate/methionine/tyrosine aminotransferase|nr:aminotransferase class I/II-fold pyridoxal phosphate-dependent enzyme [Actinomycetota bacterium]NCZ89642.1 aminotransferase class I/II-fold pyridoxal phosphate-dependent enzyme [Actinomycetota bacterium]NDD86384.1 aminotransferase class I/II-fold pyridoxal phosphate-dependent enzyme [Actinomycetota bacterium]